jgi:hypothetical protein
MHNILQDQLAIKNKSAQEAAPLEPSATLPIQQLYALRKHALGCISMAHKEASVVCLDSSTSVLRKYPQYSKASPIKNYRFLTQITTEIKHLGSSISCATAASNLEVSFSFLT